MIVTTEWQRDYIDRATRIWPESQSEFGQPAKFDCYHCYEISGERNSNAIKLSLLLFPSGNTTHPNTLTQPKLSQCDFCPLSHTQTHTRILCIDCIMKKNYSLCLIRYAYDVFYILIIIHNIMNRLCTFSSIHFSYFNFAVTFIIIKFININFILILGYFKSARLFSIKDLSKNLTIFNFVFHVAVIVIYLYIYILIISIRTRII